MRHLFLAPVAILLALAGTTALAAGQDYHLYDDYTDWSDAIDDSLSTTGYTRVDWTVSSWDATNETVTFTDGTNYETLDVSATNLVINSTTGLACGRDLMIDTDIGRNGDYMLAMWLGDVTLVYNYVGTTRLEVETEAWGNIDTFSYGGPLKPVQSYGYALENSLYGGSDNWIWYVELSHNPTCKPWTGQGCAPWHERICVDLDDLEFATVTGSP